VLLAGWIAVLIIGGNAIVAGAATIIATLELTWKGLGSALGQLTGKAERPIRDAVLDTAIATQSTC
jgi:Flp pilus assembly pilin Flp